MKYCWKQITDKGKVKDAPPITTKEYEYIFPHDYEFNSPEGALEALKIWHKASLNKVPRLYLMAFYGED